MTARVREGWPDVAKGICILLVVFWHVVTKHVAEVDWGDAGGVPDLWGLLSAQLLPLRMPLFFLVSGMFAARAVLGGERTTVAQRVVRLLGLYVLWVLIQTFVLAATPDFDTARARSIGEFLAQLTISPTNLWYLLALALYLLIGFVTRRVPTVPLLLGAFVVSAVAAAGLIPDSGNLWQVGQNLLFFLGGLRMRGAVERFASAATLPRLLFFAGVFAGGLALTALAEARHWLGVWPVLSVVAVLGGVVGCVLLQRHAEPVARPLRWIGRRTLPIYVLHMMPLALLDAALRSDPADQLLKGAWVAAIEPILLTAVVVAICLGMHVLLVRVGLGVLFDPLLLTRRLHPRRSVEP